MQPKPRRQRNAFIALKPPPIISVQLGAATRMLDFGLHGSGLFKPEGEHHLTLRFVGNSSTRQLKTILANYARRNQDMPPEFRIHLGGIHAFPNLEHPSVVWASVGGDTEALRKIQAQIDEAATELGVPPADFPFNPHITLGRIKNQELSEQEQERVRAMLTALRSDPPFYPPEHEWSVKEITAMASSRGRSDVKYETVATAKLRPE